MSVLKHGMLVSFPSWILTDDQSAPLLSWLSTVYLELTRRHCSTRELYISFSNWTLFWPNSQNRFTCPWGGCFPIYDAQHNWRWIRFPLSFIVFDWCRICAHVKSKITPLLLANFVPVSDLEYKVGEGIRTWNAHFSQQSHDIKKVRTIWFIGVLVLFFLKISL